MTCEQPIGPVLEHYGAKQVKPNRSWHKMLCPFHPDSTASATVDTTLNAFVCFACGIKGDTYGIIMKQEGVKFVEAIKIAEGITGHSNTTLRTVRKPRGGISSKPGAISGRRSESTIGIGRRAAARS